MNDILKSLLDNLAPTVTSVLLGPAAGMAVAGLGKIFGIDSASQKDIVKVLQEGKLTPEQMLQIKQLDEEFKEHEAQRGVTYAELEFKDRDSARIREATVKDHTNQILAYVIVLSFVSMVAATLSGYARVESVLAGTLIGYLSAKAEQVLAYYFGSSKGSAEKTALLAQAQPIDSSRG